MSTGTVNSSEQKPSSEGRSYLTMMAMIVVVGFVMYLAFGHVGWAPFLIGAITEVFVDDNERRLKVGGILVVLMWALAGEGAIVSLMVGAILTYQFEPYPR
jgi:hypothetical protein